MEMLRSDFFFLRNIRTQKESSQTKLQYAVKKYFSKNDCHGC